MALRAVRLTPRNLQQIGVNEFGGPTWAYTGKVWRSAEKRTIACFLPHTNPAELKIAVRRVLIVDHAADQWMPVGWRIAMKCYKERWPDSAPCLWKLPWSRSTRSGSGIVTRYDIGLPLIP